MKRISARLLSFILFAALLMSAVATGTLACTFTVDRYPTSVCANGGTSTITATVTDCYYQGLPFHRITFYVSGQSAGSISPAYSGTDFNGHACATYTSGSSTGDITITTYDTGVFGQGTPPY